MQIAVILRLNMGLSKKTRKEDSWSKRASRAKHSFLTVGLEHPELTPISASLGSIKDPRMISPDSFSLVR